MRNWSVNKESIKADPRSYQLWRLEQLINFGLGRTKLSKTALKKNLNRLQVDPQKKRYLRFLLGQ